MGFNDELAMRTLYNVGAQFVVEKANLANFNHEYIAVKNGALLYAIDSAEKMVMDGSQLNLDPLSVLDEVAFNSLAYMLVDKSGVYDSIHNAVPLSGDMRDIVASGLVQSLIQEAGIRTETQQLPLPYYLKHLASWARSKMQ